MFQKAKDAADGCVAPDIEALKAAEAAADQAVQEAAQEQGKLTPLDNEKVYLLRALQREWMEYANSEEYKNLPNTAMDAAEEKERGVRRRKHEEQESAPMRVIAPSPAELFAAHRYYHAAHGSEPFEAKG